MMIFVEPIDRTGPSILGVDPWIPGNPKPGERRQLLSEDERSRLAVIASIVRFRKGENIYSAGDPEHELQELAASFNFVAWKFAKLLRFIRQSGLAVAPSD